jgi:GTPase SAR1 family protein
VRSIRSLCLASKPFKDAFDQAVSYCQTRGIQIGAIANSTQIIVFLGVRMDGTPVANSKCLVFNGPVQLKLNFNRLWQALSPGAAQRRLLLSELSSNESIGLPPKLSSQITGYPSFRYPSESQQSLRMLSDLLIEDAPNTPDMRKRFIEECYCESGALAKEALLSKSILSARYAAMFHPASKGETLQSIKQNNDDKFGLSQEVVAEALGRRPIVIIGDVGVGKTSFIRNLIYVQAVEEMRNAIFLYVDLGSQANLGQNLHDFLIGDIERQLLVDHQVDLFEDKFVRGVYHGDLVRFERGIYGRLRESSPDRYLDEQIKVLQTLTDDRTQHLQKSIQHLSKGRGKQVIICIDNADQRDLEDQQSAFLAAQEFAAIWHALVLVSIRPRTYFASKATGSLSAYPQRVLTVSPPRVDLVLEKRLKFSLDLAEGRMPLDRLEGITIKLDSIARFLRALIFSLRNNREISELLSNITGGNIREALELVKGFIGSANVDSDKIIEIAEKGDEKYTIPLHEFSKQALLGEYSHYDSKSSIALNLFDLRYPDPREHFLSSIIVAYLLSDSRGKSSEGFFNTSDLISEVQSYCYVPDQIEHALRRLTNKKLIETTERITFQEGLEGLAGDMPLAFRATTVGSYHVLRWSGSFSYLDAMQFDTPVLDDEIRNSMLHKLGSFDIRDRFHRTTAFDKYLAKAWDMLERKPVYYDWPTIRRQGNHSFTSVQRAVHAISAR